MSQLPSNAPVLVTTTERPAGYEVKQALGQVFGVVVRSRGLGGNIMASVRSLGGGEIVEYTRLGSQFAGRSRKEASESPPKLQTVPAFRSSRA